MWIVAPLAVLGTIGAGCLIYRFVVDRLVANTSDAIKTTLAILALTGAVLAGVYAYRKQRIAESDAHRADANQFADRYTTVAEQLGHEKAAVRLAGVYALARLADDWEEQRQVCIDVLCAYLRMPYQTNPGSPEYKEGEREVRHTVIRLIRDHLSLPPAHPHSWQGLDFDFTAVTFDGGDLSGATFSGGTISFNRAEFSDGTVSFSGAAFSGGEVSFGRATFSGGIVSFDRATFSGGKVLFRRVSFSGGAVFFDESSFTGGEVSFDRADFSDGIVSFYQADSSGGRLSFDRANFSGGKVEFVGSRFVGGRVGFDQATFSSGTVTFHVGFMGAKVDFDGATFSGARVDFNWSAFSSGTVSFRGAAFPGGRVSFDQADFSGSTVIFLGASFSGGTVDLQSVASWARPPLFGTGVWGNAPAGLALPSPSQ
ncbi:pentapeptide repeat-containing protein (plasmid) [Streptomyces sp. NBC_01210]|uniref:pentapeptide repeat-containing protein n=1 Tax=Streptomyces sp. NBC_01210 TaxID=2903774 RepID=UPI002E1392B9|nr:pentapeptide repeat-containing protein [Streptomyces sp. NBC_01210]